MNQEKIARILSVSLGPQVWLPLLLIATLLKSNLSSGQLYILFPSLFLLQILIPISYLYIASHIGKVGAWDLPKREERYLFLGISFITYLISIILIYLYGNQFLLNLSLILLILLVINALVTAFWKISFHTSLNTAAVILLNLLFNWQLPWLYLLIPIVFWARLKLKRHNFSQLILGVLVSGFVVFGSFYLLGYLK